MKKLLRNAELKQGNCEEQLLKIEKTMSLHEMMSMFKNVMANQI